MFLEANMPEMRVVQQAGVGSFVVGSLASMVAIGVAQAAIAASAVRLSEIAKDLGLDVVNSLFEAVESVQSFERENCAYKSTCHKACFAVAHVLQGARNLLRG